MYGDYLFILVACLFLGACTGKNHHVEAEFKPVMENALDKDLMKAFVCEYYGEFECVRDIYLNLHEKNGEAKFLE